MKKFLIIGALALGLAAVPQQKASAWIKCNWSVGLNWNWESGNNNFLWGLMRTGQVPGYPTDFYAGGANGPPPASPYAGMMGGGGPIGYGDMGGHAPHGAPPGYVAPLPQSNEPPAGKGTIPAPAQPTTTSWYGNSAYQPAAYYQAPSYHQAPSYSYPSSYGSYGSQGYYGQGYYGQGYYGNTQVPSYWYGN